MKLMSEEQQLREMMALQEQLNRQVSVNWPKEGFDFRRAVWMECAELMEQVGWKWWRSHQCDQVQVMLEVADIWHFGLSMLLLENRTEIDIAEIARAHFQHASKPTDKLAAVENLARATLAAETFQLQHFFAVCLAVDMKFADIYCYYMGKNVLNRFRQDNGYKQGTYRKLWAGQEDNKHLAEVIVDIAPGAGYQAELYDALANRYRQMFA